MVKFLSAFFILFFMSILAIEKTHAEQPVTQSRLKNFLLPKEKFIFLAPPLINDKYFSFDFGFQVEKAIKRWNYPYHAFANAMVGEESYTVDPGLRAGIFGFKGGVWLPTQPWVPLYTQFSFGYAKTALHHDPWFGKREQSRSNQDLLYVEAGLMLKWQKYLGRVVYQVNNIKYLKKNLFVSLGVNF